MDKRFSDKSVKILVAESSSPVRQMITEVLRATGFKNIQGIGGLKEALNLLEVEDFDWLLTSLLPEQSPNALQILKIATLQPKLRTLRITLLIDPEEQCYLPAAFELGLLSWIVRPINKEGFQKEVLHLLELYKEADWHSPLVAGEFLRQHLRSTKSWAQMLAVERVLQQVYPSRADLLLHIAEALHGLGKTDEAIATLGRAKVFDPSKSGKIDSLIKVYSRGAAAADSSLVGGVGLGLKACVVIDPDGAMQRSVKAILESAGSSEVHVFSDGESAYEWIKSNAEPSLLIQEWKIPKVSGPMLIQRLRQGGHVSVPVVVMSSLVKASDRPLLREFGVAQLVEKPFDSQEFLRCIIHTIQQERMPTNTLALERRIRTELLKGELEEAKKIFQKVFHDPEIPLGRKKILEAEIEYHSSNIEIAKDLALEALKLSGDSVLTLNLIGKCLMHFGDFETALRFLEKARGLSPKNIERLCLIAEANNEIGNKLGASEALASAKVIDQGNQRIADTEIGVAIRSGDVNLARNLMRELSSWDGIISLMNNRAIALARCGKVLDGIELYKNAATSVPLEKQEFVPIILYNLALAYARIGMLKEARSQLVKVIDNAQPRVMRKAVSLKQRIESALKKKEGLVLREKVKVQFGAESHKQSPVTGSKKPRHASKSAYGNWDLALGDMCCHLIFSIGAQSEPKVEKLLEDIPKFSVRAAIVREEMFASEEVE